MITGTPKSPGFWGEEESRSEQAGDFIGKSPSASTADDDEVISSKSLETQVLRDFCFITAKSQTASLNRKK